VKINPVLAKPRTPLCFFLGQLFLVVVISAQTEDFFLSLILEGDENDDCFVRVRFNGFFHFKLYYEKIPRDAEFRCVTAVKCRNLCRNLL